MNDSHIYDLEYTGVKLPEIQHCDFTKIINTQNVQAFLLNGCDGM